jgi:hypothetical protein
MLHYIMFVHLSIEFAENCVYWTYNICGLNQQYPFTTLSFTSFHNNNVLIKNQDQLDAQSLLKTLIVIVHLVGLGFWYIRDARWKQYQIQQCVEFCTLNITIYDCSYNFLIGHSHRLISNYEYTDRPVWSSHNVRGCHQSSIIMLPVAEIW